MPDPKADVESQLKSMRKELHNVETGDRVAMWLRYYQLQDEDPDRLDWMSACYPHLKLHSWSMDDPKHPRVVFSYTVQPLNANKMGNMHGGCTATIFDFATTMPLCLINKPGFWWYLGVSRTLNVTYLRPIPVGEKILIECEIMSVGRTLSTIKGVMRRESDGVALATCEHGKFNTDPDAKL